SMVPFSGIMERRARAAILVLVTGGAMVISGLAIGGVVQGFAWENVVWSAAEVARRSSKYLWVVAAGWVVVLWGAIILAGCIGRVAGKVLRNYWLALTGGIAGPVENKEEVEA
ncbi:MAG: hypothetical protein N3G20_09245, partial [Verrucomicrobiae bacterium]|nr:hypothetical protein [Verrucomicrobiae bacterium]